MNINHTTRFGGIAVDDNYLLNYESTTESTIIYAVTQITKPPHSNILWLLMQTTLHNTQTKGKINGISDFLRQLPVVLSCPSIHPPKIPIPLTTRMQSSSRWVRMPKLLRCQTSRPFLFTTISHIIHPVTNGISKI